MATEADDLARALRSLLSDIEGMHMPLRMEEGDAEAHDAEPQDYFGPFECWYDEADQTMCEGDGVRVCWPNLRISMEIAEKVLKAHRRG